MFEKNTPKIVKIKLEPQDNDIREEEQIGLPAKHFNLSTELNYKDQEISAIEKTTIECELEKRLKSLAQSNNQQQETIKSLTKTCNDVTIKNQNLEQAIQGLQEENKQLKEQLENKFKVATDSTKELGDHLRSELSNHTTVVNSTLDKRCKELQQQEINFQASLSQTEQQHHEELLSQYKSLRKKLESTTEELDGFKSSIKAWSTGVAASGGMVYGDGWRLPSAPALKI